jgi:hypothetical protein
MASFQKDVNYQAGLAKLFVTTVTDPATQVAFNANVNPSLNPAGYCGGIYIGGDGNLIVVMAQDTTNTLVTFNGVKAGTFLPIQVKRVSSTSTATNIMGLW